MDSLRGGMLSVSKRMRAALPTARLVLQVHDEVVLEDRAAQAAMACAKVKALLGSAVNLDVPLVVDVHTAADWGGLK